MSLDATPPATLHAELNATVHELEQGLAQVPLAKAVNGIANWQRLLRDADRADLTPIADGLADLERHLEGAPPDRVVIGETLARLGAQTEGVAGTAPEAMQAALHRLGSILRRAGRALAGNNARSA